MKPYRGLGTIDEKAMILDPPHARQWGPELLVLESGKGCRLRDVNGRQYIDLGAGIAVNALGYGRSDLARIAARQMRKLVHTSAAFTSPQTIAFGRRLVESGFAAVHFGNSGTEANEAALKYARLYARRTRGGRMADCHTLVCFSGAFHGRTMGSLSVTPTPAYQEPFLPLVPGVETLPFNDRAALEAAVAKAATAQGSRIAGIIVEVVQGEGGLEVITAEFSAALNDLCRQHDIVLIADEVQTGLGRTGRLFACEGAGLRPDIVTLAKPLAGGLPLGVALIPPKINDVLRVGDHGGTFGGGPVTCALASHIWDTVRQPSFLAKVNGIAAHLEAGLKRIVDRFQDEPLRLSARLRGRGLLRGIAIEGDRAAELLRSVLTRAQAAGVLVLRSGRNVIRIAPPLVIGRRDLDEGLARLEQGLRAALEESKAGRTDP